jgi:hypothetical protein
VLSDEVDPEGEERYFEYKRRTSKAGREPLGWAAWIDAGFPLPDEEDDHAG